MKTDKELSPQQIAFIDYCAQGMSQRQAYRLAFPKTKAKPENIDSLASKIMSIDKAKTRLDELRQNAKKKSGKTAEEMLALIINVESETVGAKITDFYEIDEEGNMRVKKPDESLPWYAVKEVLTDKNGKVYGYKFHDRDDAIDQLKDLYHLADQQTDTKVEISFSDDIGELAE